MNEFLNNEDLLYSSPKHKEPVLKNKFLRNIDFSSDKSIIRRKTQRPRMSTSLNSRNCDRLVHHIKKWNQLRESTNIGNKKFTVSKFANKSRATNNRTASINN